MAQPTDQQPGQSTGREYVDQAIGRIRAQAEHALARGSSRTLVEPRELLQVLGTISDVTQGRRRPCGQFEIAVLHRVDQATVHRWFSRGLLAPNDALISMHRVWSDVGLVERWSRQTGRFEQASRTWAERLGMLVEGEDGEPRPAPQLVAGFDWLYDHLRLGQPDTDLRHLEQEIAADRDRSDS